jgi:hypothetical protein
VLAILIILGAAAGGPEMRRFIGWLRGTFAEGLIAMSIAIVFAVLTVLDVLGANNNVVNAAILLTLALLALTMLRDRAAVDQALLNLAAVRLVSGKEISQALADARKQTDIWIHKGGTGGFLRTVTLPQCVEHARQGQRTLRVQLEIIDPTNESACTAYARFRGSVSPSADRRGAEWTPKLVAAEAYATILAACWHSQHFRLLTVEIGLSQVMSTFRWDLSRTRAIQSQEDPEASSLVFGPDQPYYDACHRELISSFKQARRVPVDRADACQLGGEPDIDQARKLFVALGLDLPSSFSDRDVADIIFKAIAEKRAFG